MKDDYDVNSHYSSLIHFSGNGWENVLYELWSESVKPVSLDRLPTAKPRSPQSTMAQINSVKHEQKISVPRRWIFTTRLFSVGPDALTSSQAWASAVPSDEEPAQRADDSPCKSSFGNRQRFYFSRQFYRRQILT